MKTKKLKTATLLMGLTLMAFKGYSQSCLANWLFTSCSSSNAMYAAT